MLNYSILNSKSKILGQNTLSAVAAQGGQAPPESDTMRNTGKRVAEIADQKLSTKSQSPLRKQKKLVDFFLLLENFNFRNRCCSCIISRPQCCQLFFLKKAIE